MMGRKEITMFLIGLSLVVRLGTATPITGAPAPPPDASGQQPSTEPASKEKGSLEEKAVTLLEQVVSEAQGLRLPENRIRIQILAGDLMWERSEPKARGLFSAAAAILIEMMQSQEAETRDRFNRQNFNQTRFTIQLRQELLLTVARHDAALAYQLLAMTRPPAAAPDNRNPRRPDGDANLEQSLQNQIAALDPKQSLQNALAQLNKGQYPSTLARVLSQLQTKDKDAAAGLRERLIKQLQSENLIANRDAINLSFSLLQPGPQPEPKTESSTSSSTDPATASPAPPTANANQVLNATAYRNLLETLVAAAIKVQPQPQTGGNQRGQGNGRNGGNNNQRGRPAPPTGELTAAEIEQNNGRALLMGLQAMLPQVDQYLPARAPMVRQKLSEAGLSNDPRLFFSQFDNLIQQGTSDSLATAAATAPPGLQPRLYQQAAMKALSEGNVDRARQIANERLDPAMRDALLQTIEFQQTGNAADPKRLDEVKQTLARLRSDDERVNLLLQLSSTSQKSNRELALQFLVEAQNLVGRRASNYQQLESQLKVSHAMAALDPTRSFELLESGIGQLNELLSAAALLNGFEVNIFRDGELPIQGGSMLTNTIMRYGQELATLAKSDFDRAQNVADKFQTSEPRIFARLSIASGLLGGQALPPSTPTGFGGRGFGGPNPPIFRRAQ